MANKVTIDVEARFVDNITDESKAASKAVEGIGKEADKAQKQVDKLGKKKASPVFDADNNKFLNKIRSMEAKMSKLGHTKTAAVLQAVDKASTVIGKVMNKAKQFGEKTWQGLLKFKDSDAMATIKKVTSGVESLTKKTWTAIVNVKNAAMAPINAIKKSLFSIPTLIKTVIAAKVVQETIVKPITLADAYSSAKIGFETLLGESEAVAMMNKIDAFAKATPFKTSGVISNVQKMMAYGWDVDRVIDDMNTIGDAAAATGKRDAGLESIVRALAEIRSKGKLSTQELNQLAGAGIKAKAYLAEGLGYGSSDEGMMKLAKDLESGAIGANQAIELILKGMKEFDGMMDKTANETVDGLISQIEDAFEINILRRWGQGLQDGVKRGFGSIVTLLDEADEALGRLGDVLYEIGANISNWVADKFENAIGRIMDITDTFEFKNASLGEKVSMLWNGAIVDPLKEWWEGGGSEKSLETANKIGKWIGDTLTTALLAILGVTDVFKKSGLDEDGGTNIGRSFVKGFVDGFDTSAITKKLVEAISNVWSALPWWGKVLVGSYVGGKTLSGVGDVVGGISNLVGGIGNLWGMGRNFLGSTGNSMVGGSGILGKLADIGYALKGGAPNAAGYFSAAGGMSGGAAALTGGATVAGGIAAIAGTIHTGASAIKGIQALREGDKTSAMANFGKAGAMAASMGIGAAIGTAIGTAVPVIGNAVGAIVGTGIGAIVGFIGGDKLAAHIEAASYETEGMKAAIKDGELSAEELAEQFEKAKYESAKKHFGDIALSMDEIQRLANQIVWDEDLAVYEKFSAATKAAKDNLQSMKTAAVSADKWMWKAGLGVRFNADEKEAFIQSFNDYVKSAQGYLENKHYEFSTSAELLLDLESEVGKSILEGGNAFYLELQGQLDAAGQELGNTLTQALEDGIINADENAAIVAAQQKVASITEKIANADAEAELELAKVKFGYGNLDIDSFENFMSTMSTTIEERVNGADESFKVQVSNLKLRFPEGGEEFDDALQALINGYKGEVETIQATVMDVELDIIADAYKAELGGDAKQDLNNAIKAAIDGNIDPIEWTDERLAEIVGVDELTGETAGNLKEMLSKVFGQIKQLDVDEDVLLKIGSITVDEKSLKGAIDKGMPDMAQAGVTLCLWGEVQTMNNIKILAEDFGISDVEARTILWKLTGAKSVVEKVNILSEEFGINTTESKTVLWKLTGQKQILNPFNLTAANFGIKGNYTFNPTVTVSPIKQVTNSGVSGKKFRGGIVGGSSAMERFALGGRPDDGMLKGSTRFIMVNEESPEMIIPLSSQRRGRALKLWAQAGNIMGVPGFARGGMTSGGNDEGIRFQSYGSNESAGGQSVQVDVGGITFEINVNGDNPQAITEAIKAQAEEIADVVAGVLADSLSSQFENTPTRGGAA